MLERALKWAKIQRDAAELMTDTWTEFVPGWRRMLDAYKQDHSIPNPFEEPNTGKTPFIRPHDRLMKLLKDTALAGLKDQLAKEDSDTHKKGINFPHKMTPSLFIQQALEVEAAQ